MPYQRSERFIGPQLWAQAWSEMGQGMADAIKQHRQLKEESEGLDMTSEMLKKQFQDDPTAYQKFGEEWSKWPGMSNTQKKAFLGGLGAYMGNQLKARDAQQRAQEAALRMSGMAQEQERKLEEDAALRRFGSAMTQRQTEPNAPGNFMFAMQEAPLGVGMENIQRFAPQPGVRTPAPPMTGSEMANIGVQAGVMDPQVIQRFADLTQQQFEPGTMEDVPGAPWMKFFRAGRTGGGTFSKVPDDPKKFAGQSSQAKRIPGMPGFYEVTKPDGTRLILREPVVDPLIAALAAKIAGSGPGGKPDAAKDMSPVREEIAKIKDPKARAAAELAYDRWTAGRLSDEEYLERLQEYTE